MTSSDLHVDSISESLSGVTLDVAVTGSIGAVESVRFIRSLRRLGASVVPWLSAGGSQFVTETSLSWAAAHPAITKFSGTAAHIATGDACVISPASANTIAKIANGSTDTPVSAMVASYLGQGKPVLIVMNMHNSLLNSPMVQRNIELLQDYCIFLNPREEEGKQKFPEPPVLADQVSHFINKGKAGKKSVISMGTTKAYLDDVRYLSNYSSGSLGTKIASELYRLGIETHVVCGPCQIKPKSYSYITHIETNNELEAATSKAVQDDRTALVFLSSVLDFVPKNRRQGKVRSSEANLNIELVKTEKIIGKIQCPSQVKVGFKLEPEVNLDQALAIAKDYMSKYHLSMIVINSLKEVDPQNHAAFLFWKEETDQELKHTYIKSKERVAQEIALHVTSKLKT